MWWKKTFRFFHVDLLGDKSPLNLLGFQRFKVTWFSKIQGQRIQLTLFPETLLFADGESRSTFPLGLRLTNAFMRLVFFLINSYRSMPKEIFFIFFNCLYCFKNTNTMRFWGG